jgi:hypothetical protein
MDTDCAFSQVNANIDLISEWNVPYAVFALWGSCWQTCVAPFVEIYHILFWNMWENASIREAVATGRNIWEMLEYMRLAYENTGNMCDMMEKELDVSSAWPIHVKNFLHCKVQTLYINRWSGLPGCGLQNIHGRALNWKLFVESRDVLYPGTCRCRNKTHRTLHRLVILSKAELKLWQLFPEQRLGGRVLLEEKEQLKVLRVLCAVFNFL